MERKPQFDLRAVALRDDVTGEVFHEFSVPTAEGRIVKVTVRNGMPLAAKANEIRRHTTLFPARGAANLIETAQLRAKVPLPQTSRTGWKRGDDGQPVAFALPGRMIEFRPLGYRWAGSIPMALSGLGEVKGDLKTSTRVLASLTSRSRYIAFVVMAALAGPLRQYARLPESPIFAFYGASSTGKTTLLRIAASIQGEPKATASWDLSPRALAEAAASTNDLTLLLDAAERCSKGRLIELLDRIVHSVSEGASSGRSASVHDRLPDLAWQGVTLSSANQSGHEMAARHGRTWEPQDAARYLDVPVPSAGEGGIFDKLRTDEGFREDLAQAELQAIEELITSNHGVLMEPWIRHLARDGIRSRVQELVDRFIRDVGSPVGIEERIARKFALIYAAGVIANRDAKLLDWPNNRPFSAVSRLYRKSIEARTSKLVPECVKTFALRLQDRRIVRPVIDKMVRVKKGHELFAIKAQHRGRDVYGVRIDEVRRAWPGDEKMIQRWLSEQGITIRGQGGEMTCQLPVEIVVGGQRLVRPRMLLLDRKKLKQSIA